LTQQQLIRIAFHMPSQAELREGLLIPLQQRIRDVVQGPDGYLYVATEKGLRGNTADGMVLRIEPADQYSIRKTPARSCA
jgi:glucose/arabinose dehydrogenase